MRQIHTSIVSMHLATRGNNKILRTPPPHIVAPLPNSEQINHPSSNHNYTKSTTQHNHDHYAPFVTLTYTPHFTLSLQLHPHAHHIVTPGFVDRPARVTALLVRWTKKLTGGPQAVISNYPF